MASKGPGRSFNWRGRSLYQSVQKQDSLLKRKRIRDNSEGDTTIVNAKKNKNIRSDPDEGSSLHNAIFIIDSDSDMEGAAHAEDNSLSSKLQTESPTEQLSKQQPQVTTCTAITSFPTTLTIHQQQRQQQQTIETESRTPDQHTKVNSDDHDLPCSQFQSQSVDSKTPETATQASSIMGRQKVSSAHTPIQANIIGGRRTPPPKRKRFESSQSTIIVPLICEAEDRLINNDSQCNISRNESNPSLVSSGNETAGQSTSKHKRTRCGQCSHCRMPDCRKCLYCQNKERYRKACKERKDCIKWNSHSKTTSQDGVTANPSTAQHTTHSGDHYVNRLGTSSQESQSEMSNDEDESFQLLFNEAIEDCKVSVFIAKCGITGPPGSGKSHLRALILNKKRPIQRKSTAIAAEADQATPDWINFEENLVEIDEIKDGSRVKWYVVDTSKMSGLAAKTMHRHLHMKERDKSRSAAGSYSKAVKKFKVTKKIRKIFRELQGKPSSRRRKCLHKMNLVYLVDAGGQPQFQEIMPMFVRNSSVNILVHKLPEKLSDCPEFDYEVDGKKFSVPEEMLITNREIIEQSLRSISSCSLTHSIRQRASSRPPKPYVAIVGMFKDKCTNQALVEEKQVAIKDCLSKYEKVDFCTASRDKPVFTFDASESGWDKNGEMLATLRANIQQICETLEVEIPLRWFIFLEIIKEYSKNRKFISLQECYDIARESDVCMSKEQVDEALQLFDELNMILHYSDILPNVVFCKPEFLFNKVSQIIVASFDCRQEIDITRLEREKFRKTGIFSIELLKKIPFVFHDLDNNVFKEENLLFLLKSLCIIADLGNDNYFMPCVLPLERFNNDVESSDSHILTKYHDVSEIKNPLFVSFDTEFSPRGLFCASIAYLAKQPSWIITHSHSSFSGLYRRRNAIEFEYHLKVPAASENLTHSQSFSEGTVLVTDRISHFEVYSTCDAQYCSQIRKEIYSAFCHAAESLSYNLEELNITVGFQCEISCGKIQPHGTAVNFRREGVATERCLRNRSKRPVPLNSDEKLVWFNTTITNSSTATNPEPLSLVLLMEEVASKTNYWKNIGLQLRLEQVDLERIECEQNHMINECFRGMFDLWERRCTSSYSWKTVIEALESQSVNEVCLARYLKTKYLLKGPNTEPIQPHELVSQNSEISQQISQASGTAAVVQQASRIAAVQDLPPVLQFEKK